MYTILLIDEDVFSRNVFARALSSHGHQVMHADSRVTAEAILAGETNLDMLVVDTSIGCDGALQFLRAIREREISTPVLLCRSVFEEQDLDASSLGIFSELRKPIAPTAFVRKIEEMLGGSLGLEEETEIERREEFASRLEARLLHLEQTIRLAAAKEQSSQASIARDLAGTCSEYGFQRVSQALARVAQALDRISARPETYSRQLWAELTDSMDEAFVSARRQLMEFSESGPRRETSTRQVTNIVIFDPTGETSSPLATQGAAHLIHVLEARSIEAWERAIREPGIDGMMIDLDQKLAHEAARLATQHHSSHRVLPLAAASTVSDLNARKVAAELGAVRFIEKPVQAQDFGDAVRFLAMQSRAPSVRALVVHPREEDRGRLVADLHDHGIESLAVTSNIKLLQELDVLDPDALVLWNEDNDAPTIVRVLRAIPRWADLPILCLNNEASHSATCILAGADEELTLPEDAALVAPRLIARVRRAMILRERSEKDTLTSLLTRRAFLERISTRLSEARRQSRNLSVCLLDLDRFKRINDTYGHLVGDKVLIQLGRLLRERFRMEDLRCRWGGEEFAIALVNEDGKTSDMVLQRVLDEFGEIDFEAEDGTVFHCTFSAGIAEFPSDGPAFEDLLRTADEKLFQSKVAGRSRITR